MRPRFFFGETHEFHRHGPRGFHRRGFGGGRGGRGGGFDERDMGMTRLLAHGDLRLLVLLLVEEQPRHGYELIKLIESKSSHQYSPSPGVIYPTLTYLDETGLVTTADKEDKKQYSITPEGSEYLNQNRDFAKAILQRLEEMGALRASAKAEAMNQERDLFGGEDLSEIRNIFRAIHIELRNSRREMAKKKKDVVAILKRALDEIIALKKSGSDSI